MILYRLLTRHNNDSRCGAEESYGITVYQGNTVVRTIEDISPDREKLESLIDIFNSERLSPIHLDEAVENFLYDFEV